ncbi:MAG: hypothetical protein M1825_000412 [Sarcosagium campestre]|nr:MAG: hypothetical protein M1825_000412 [Sarcosagium campestre]
MANKYRDESTEFIENELGFYKVMFETNKCQDPVDVEAEQMYRQEIQELEGALASRIPDHHLLQYDGAEDGRSNGEPPLIATRQANVQTPKPAQSGQLQSDATWLHPSGWSSSSNTASNSTPQSLGSSNMDVPQRKRVRDSTDSLSTGFDRPLNKSRRTTPSPQLTGPTTPSSTPSYGSLVGFLKALPISTSEALLIRYCSESGDLADIMSGSNGNTTRKRLMERELAFNERARQEREDAEFARMLQESESLDRTSQLPSGVLSGHEPALFQDGLEDGFHSAQRSNLAVRNQGASQRDVFSSGATGNSTRAELRGPATSVYGNQMPRTYIDLDEYSDEDIPSTSAAPPTAKFALGTFPEQTGNIDFLSFHDDVDFDFPDSYDRLRKIQQGLSSPQASSGTSGLPRGPSAPYGIAGQNLPGFGMDGSRIGSSVSQASKAIAPFQGSASNGFESHQIDPADPWGSNNAFGMMPGGFPGSSIFGGLDLGSLDSFSDRQARLADYVVNDPTKTREQIAALLVNIKTDADIPPENREGTPPAMKYALMPHQSIGLTWMKKMEEGSNKGGILADDMGLGKTIQALALMVSRPSTDPNRKTTLVIAPVALMKQWEREISTKLNPEHQLRTFILHGARRKAKWSTLKDYDVVLTTFGTIASEFRIREEWNKMKRADRSLDDSMAPDLPLLGPDSLWYRIIVDEAQCIKNRTTKAALGSCALQASSRFLLTGTPMMNRVSELHSLIEFLRIEPYNNQRRFNTDFTIPLGRNSEYSKSQAMRKLQALLKAILLRRTKTSLIDGQPILNLKPRVVEIVHAVFDPDQQSFYSALESKTLLQFNKYLRQGTVGRNYSNVLVLLLRLRQACCHPHLIQDFGQETVIPEISVDEMLELAKRLSPDVVSRIKLLEAFECPVCYDAVENPAIFVPCGHDSCAECLTKICEQTGLQGLAQGEERADVKCPTCRARISQKKCIDYTTFRRAHMPETVPTEEVAQTNGDDDDDDEEDETDSSSDVSGSDDDAESLADFVVESDDDSDAERSTSKTASLKGKGKASFGPGEEKKKTKKKKDGKGKGKAKESIKTIAQLKKESMRSIKARQRYMRRLERDWAPSAKVDKCIEILEKVLTDSRDEKTIVFSQFTSLLDLLEVPLRQRKWGFKRYDGSMSAAKRNDAVLEFSDDANTSCRIMLVSLKAGNAGLNLVAASQVIIFDPFWNPFVEEQAIDRTHRIGQQREVKVHRLLVAGTVEDRIVDLQEKKRQLIEGALDETANRDIGRLGLKELSYLFGVPPE